MGDRLAIQYGGSEMHRQMANDKTASATMASQMYQKRSRPKTREMMISVRFYLFLPALLLFFRVEKLSRLF